MLKLRPHALIMGYPLGSFPRFGHQERWASERRQRAQANSAATLRWKKGQALNAEICFFNSLVENFWGEPTANNEEGERTIARIDKRLNSIKRKLESGERVYWKRLGIMYRDILIEIPDESILVHAKGQEYLAHVQQMRAADDQYLAEHVKGWGEDLYFKEKYGDFDDDAPTATATKSEAKRGHPPMDYDVPAAPASREWSLPSSEGVQDWVSIAYKALGVLAVVGFMTESGTLLMWAVLAAAFLFPIWLWTL